MKKIHIVGCGQVGSIIATYLIKQGYPIKVYTPFNQHDCQNPWGWVRRITLNQEERKSDQSILSMNKKYRKKGAMIISTSCPSRQSIWESWIKAHPESDAKMLSKDESTYHNLNQKEHHLLCDSNDFLFDFSKQKQEHLKYIEQNIDNNFVNDDIINFVEKNDKISQLQGIQSNYPIEKDDIIIFCLGNQTRRFFKVPILGIRLAYFTLQNQTNIKSNYLAHWADKSSIQYFDDYTKIACGMNGCVDFLPPLQYWYLYLVFLKKRNYAGFDEKEHIRQAAQERGFAVPINYSSCVVDITPNFLPYLEYSHSNSIVICGFSGSGFTAYESFFLEHVEKMVSGEKHSLFTRKNSKSYLY